MSERTANTQFGRDDFIPMSLWSKDHWSTLAYIETKLVDDGGKCTVKFDARMRQNRRNYRVLIGQRMSGTGAIPMSVDHGTRLNDGTYLPNHDDWNCLQDMQAAGLFEGDVDDWDRGMALKLTDAGRFLAAALRQHKAAGGTFSTFKGDNTFIISPSEQCLNSTSSNEKS